MLMMVAALDTGELFTFVKVYSTMSWICATTFGDMVKIPDLGFVLTFVSVGNHVPLDNNPRLRPLVALLSHGSGVKSMYVGD